METVVTWSYDNSSKTYSLTITFRNSTQSTQIP